jgi:sec-independent protein translocase protein TatA
MTDLFDSPWKILIIAVLIIVLFGARKLPVAARELGKSMRILKSEVQGLHQDEPAPSATVQDTPPAAAPAQLQAAAPAAATDAQAQIDALSQQLANLQASVDSKDGAQAK